MLRGILWVIGRMIRELRMIDTRTCECQRAAMHPRDRNEAIFGKEAVQMLLAADARRVEIDTAQFSREQRQSVRAYARTPYWR
jgi:hypothetical protein